MKTSMTIHLKSSCFRPQIQLIIQVFVYLKPQYSFKGGRSSCTRLYFKCNSAHRPLDDSQETCPRSQIQLQQGNYVVICKMSEKILKYLLLNSYASIVYRGDTINGYIDIHVSQ